MSEYITQKELSIKLGISQQLLNYYIQKGHIHTKLQFGKVLVPANTILILRKDKK